MEKQEIAKEIQATEERLKALREKLQEPEKVIPKTGDVVDNENGTTLLVTDEGQAVHLSDRGITAGVVCVEGSKYANDAHNGEYKRLGTFDEVYVRRDEVDKDYILKSEVSDTVNRALNLEDSYGDTLQSTIDPHGNIRHEAVEMLKELL